MPYRLNPKNKREVQKKTKGGWVHKKTFETVRDAEAHRDALNINVKH